MSEMRKDRMRLLKDSRYITDKLFRKGISGLTVAELLGKDSRLASYTLDELQITMDDLERDKLVYSEDFDRRGKVYRPLVFETFGELCQAKASSTL